MTGDREIPVNWKNVAHYLAVGAIQYDDSKMEKRLLGFLKRVEEEEMKRQRELVEERIANDDGTPIGTLRNKDNRNVSFRLSLNYDTKEFLLYPVKEDKPAISLNWEDVARACANKVIEYDDPKMEKRLLGYLARESLKTTSADDAGNGDDNGSGDSGNSQMPDAQH